MSVDGCVIVNLACLTTHEEQQVIGNHTTIRNSEFQREYQPENILSSPTAARATTSQNERTMFKGVLTAFAIMLLAIPIPAVHFVAIPISPFVAGFVGGGIAKADEMKIVWFGFIVGALMLIPAAAIIIYWQISDAERFLGAPTLFWAIIGFAIAPYAWFGTTIGALISYLMRSRSSNQSSTGT